MSKCCFKKQKYEFFVESKNSVTNKTLAEQLGTENYSEHRTDTNGYAHKLWACSLDYIERLKKMQLDDQQINFKTFAYNKMTGKLSEFNHLRSMNKFASSSKTYH